MRYLARFTAAALIAFLLPLQTFAWGPNAERLIANRAFETVNTTESYDGRAWGQPGVNLRFDTSLVDRYSLFFPLQPNDASFIPDPTDHAFQDCIKAHSWLEIVLVADRSARTRLSDYTDEYYDRFYSEVGATLIRQLSDAAADVGSYWLTSWTNAGRPALPR